MCLQMSFQLAIEAGAQKVAVISFSAVYRECMCVRERERERKRECLCVGVGGKVFLPFDAVLKQAAGVILSKCYR